MINLHKFKPAKHYEQYFSVSENGDVYSYRTKKLLRIWTNKRNRKVFSTCLNGRKENCICLRVHRLVAETFIPNPLNKPFVNHIDGNPSNNHVSNLEWVTHKENMIHASKTGLLGRVKGAQCAHAKLTVENVLTIRSIYKAYDSVNGGRALAKKYNVSYTCIKKVVHNKTYTDC